MVLTKSIVFVIDDEASVRKALGRVLQQAGYQMEAFGSAQEFLQRMPYDGPGCIILDVQMPGLNGVELQGRLVETKCFLPIIFLSGHSDIPISVRAMKAGAVDFLTKPFKNPDLLEAVRISLHKDAEARAMREEAQRIQQHLDTLTDREKEVLRWVVGGHLNKQIAYELGISEATVKAHRAHVMEKMQANSLADLVRLVEKVGIVPAGVPRGTSDSD